MNTLAGRIFIHFLDKEVLNLLGVDTTKQNEYNSRIYRELRLATRLSFLLCSERVLIPASNYFESAWAKQILDELPDFGNFGYLGFISSSMNIQDFIAKKQDQYSADTKRYPIYFSNSNYAERISTWIPRQNSATEDISNSWIASIDDSIIWKRIYKKTTYKTVERFELDLEEIPDKLEDSAFISDFVFPLISWKKDQVLSRYDRHKNYLNVLITKAYINSFLEEFNAVCLKDIPIVDTGIILSNDRPHISMLILKQKLLNSGILEEINTMKSKSLFDFKHSKLWTSFQTNIMIETMYDQVQDNEEILGLGKPDLAKTSSNSKAYFSEENSIFNFYTNITVSSQSESKNEDQNIVEQSGNFGVGINKGEIKTHKIAGNLNEVQAQTLTEVVAEIQQVVNQLSQTYPTTTTTEQMVVALEVIKQVESNPSWKQRVINTAKEGGLSVFEKALDNPIGTLITRTIKDWLEAQAD